MTEEDVRGAATSGGQTPGHGRRDGGSRFAASGGSIVEHMSRAHREVPAVTWVEECDFGNVDLRRSCRPRSRPARETLREYPRAERTARGRRDRLPRPLRHRRRGPDRPGPRRAGRPRVRHGVRRRARTPRSNAWRRQPAPERSRPTSCVARPSRSRAQASSAGSSRRRSSTTRRSAILSLGRVAERPVVRDGEVVVRPLGYISVTFDHRVVDGARAAEFGLAVIRRLEAPAASP